MKTAVFFPRRARHLGPSRGPGLARCWYASRRRDLRFGSATRSPRATDTEYPIRAGHELSGEVVAAGPDVTTLEPGRRVGIEPLHLLGCPRLLVAYDVDAEGHKGAERLERIRPPVGKE